MPIQLIRHGKYSGESLTEAGRLQSLEARELLLAKGLGEKTTILTSSALRAVQTAEILTQDIGSGSILSSEIIKEAGNYPIHVNNLDRVIEKALEAYGFTELPDELVVVAHMPLLSMVKSGNQYTDIPHCAITEYKLGSWQNPEYNPDRPGTKIFEQTFNL